MGTLGRLKKKAGEFFNSIARKPFICKVEKIAFIFTICNLRKFLLLQINEIQVIL